MTARIDRTIPLGNSAGGKRLPDMHSLPVPSIDYDLIVYLKGAFKVIADPSHSLCAYRRMEGHQAVINHLEALWRDQNNS